ncbi:MAG: hypothetical protein ACRBM6_18140 [Geminicoccales bacterium]
MTKLRTTFVAAIGFLSAGLFAAVPVSAGVLNVAKPTVSVEQRTELQLVDRGSWSKKKHFKKKHFKKKHYRGDHYGRDDYYYDDGYRHGKGKRKYKRGYRHGYQDGYDRGRRDRGYRYGRGYGRYGHEGPRFRRGRGYRHDHRHGSGYIKAPGLYFRF